MKIFLESQPFFSMRYNTIGDWYYEDNTLRIKVAESYKGIPLSEKEQFLIALHELIEVTLCGARGISQKAVDEFDFVHQDVEGEVGDIPGAPYRKEHRFAMLIEHLMAHELGLAGYGKVE